VPVAEVCTLPSQVVIQRPPLTVQRLLVVKLMLALDSFCSTSARVFWQSRLASFQSPNCLARS